MVPAFHHVFQALEYDYKLCGDNDKADETLALAKELAKEQEELFGMHTDFLENGSVLISYPAAGVSEPAETTA